MIHIEINPHRKVNAFTNEFNELFPALFLRIYYRPAEKSDHSKRAHLQKEHFAEKAHDLLSDCQIRPKSGTLDFYAEMTVHQFKDLLENDFGIHAEIYQKSGKNERSSLPVPSENPLFEANFEVHKNQD